MSPLVPSLCPPPMSLPGHCLRLSSTEASLRQGQGTSGLFRTGLWETPKGRWGRKPLRAVLTDRSPPVSNGPRWGLGRTLPGCPSIGEGSGAFSHQPLEADGVGGRLLQGLTPSLPTPTGAHMGEGELLLDHRGLGGEPAAHGPPSPPVPMGKCVGANVGGVQPCPVPPFPGHMPPAEHTALVLPGNRKGLASGSPLHPASPLRIEVRLQGGLPGTQAVGEKGWGLCPQCPPRY